MNFIAEYSARAAAAKFGSIKNNLKTEIETDEWSKIEDEIETSNTDYNKHKRNSNERARANKCWGELSEPIQRWHGKIASALQHCSNSREYGGCTLKWANVSVSVWCSYLWCENVVR